jgi:very-short-patch-repair endonuclease
VGLPLPLVNEPVRAGDETFKCDFVWLRSRLIVETDGRRAHVRSRQFEEDRRRDAILKLAGWTVVRFTWRQAINEPEWVVTVLKDFLADATPRGTDEKRPPGGGRFGSR